MDAPVTYIPGFAEHPDAWFTRLWEELDWEKRPDAPRREYWTNTLGRSYTYGRGAGERTYHARASHDLIDIARDRLKADGHGFFSGCFLNGYDNKRDWLGWHADDDPGIDHTLPIAVITVGQGRNIQFREVLEKPVRGESKGVYGPTVTQMLESGSLLLMHAGMQSNYEHRIPKADFEAKPRISLTFRGLL